jgi:hypothetical protein
MVKVKHALTVLAVVIASHSVYPQASLRNWVGKYPTNRHDRRFTNVFTALPLKPKLQRLLGRNFYRRVTFNNNFTEFPILLADNYAIITTCEAHNCVSKQMFLAVNLDRGDVHVALYHYGSLDWFHTTGKSSDLPNAVREKLADILPPPRNVREITRGAI